jgi:polyisoprenoid-binding protein YceI
MKMKLKILSIALIALFSTVIFQASAQKYITKTGQIIFFSETPMESIQADNRQVNAALDPLTGDFVFKVLIKSFQFEKALMQEHFNENYMESDKYPNSTFQGKVTNLSDIDFNKPGTYPVTIEGDMTIHNVTRKINEKGTFTVESGVVKGNSKFKVKPSDYDIKIPGAVINNIAEEIEVTVNVELNRL